MSDLIRPIGWFMRYFPDATLAPHFWLTQLDMPLIRKVGPAMDIAWAGEAVVIELAYSLPKDVPQNRPWAYMPIYRVHGLDAILSRLKSKELFAESISESGGDREAILLDPYGHPIALRERSVSAGLPQDQEARRRWMRGEAFNPGCKPMPEGFQEIGWIQRRVADMARMSDFYKTVVGLADLGTHNGRPLFDLGDNVILELVPGGTVMTPPQDRKEADALIIMRVDQIEKYRAHLEVHGTTIINRKIDVYWGEVSYFVDPEGQVIGIENARHPGTYAPEKAALTEGLEAERRWREKMGRQQYA